MVPSLLGMDRPNGTSGAEHEEVDMTEDQGQATWGNVAEWHGKMIVDRNGEKIGKLQGVYVDVETDEPVVGLALSGRPEPAEVDWKS